MGETRVTDKFQVTIPKDVREKVGIKPGEVLLIEPVGEEKLVIKRFGVVKDPLRVLVGKRKYRRHVPIEEIERKVESR
ncbi:MAG: AbrB/MazE/SpoVT family DNA-binding domain-containing protein [Candidatus Hadarchaeota archaeon]|nr:AbrB/MazE/SpoVT family DNA-binding domain-containing protein [Candidatus Hadarchaeota archaeon]